MPIFVGMMRFSKIILLILSANFFIVAFPSCKPKAGTNAYLHMKTKPSAKQQNQNKRIIKRQEKMYKKQIRTNRKRLFGRKTAPKAPKN